MRNGETLAADLIVLATGYKGQEHLVRKLFGDEVAERVGPIWGFGDEQELRNMFTRTAQPGLWFIAGSLAQCRIYSKYLGLADQGLRDRPDPELARRRTGFSGVTRRGLPQPTGVSSRRVPRGSRARPNRLGRNGGLT